jgi:hypothetical protein
MFIIPQGFLIDLARLPSSEKQFPPWRKEMLATAGRTESMSKALAKYLDNTVCKRTAF